MAAHSTPKVLVIDDESEVIDMIQNLLDMLGYASVATTQWTEAVDAAEHENPQLMLLDLNMPTIDGAALLKFMREQGYTFPVVVISGYIDADIRENLTPLGVVAFVDKPFEIKHLSDIIAQVLPAPKPLDTPPQEHGSSAPASSAPASSASQASSPPKSTPSDSHDPGVLTPRKRKRHTRERVIEAPSRGVPFLRRSSVQYVLIAIVCMLLGGLLIAITKQNQDVPVELYPSKE